MDKRVRAFLKTEKNWQEEMILLRDLIMQNDLKEDFKWMHPCYTYNDKNVVLIHGFKTYCALLFHKGALLKDSKKLLVQQTKNVQAARQLRFRSVEEIQKIRPYIAMLLKEARQNEKERKDVKLKETSDYQIPSELIQTFEEDPEYKSVFNNLTPGRQRGYLLHFNGAKQSKTRMSRIKKAKSKILEGKGHNER